MNRKMSKEMAKEVIRQLTKARELCAIHKLPAVDPLLAQAIEGLSPIAHKVELVEPTPNQVQEITKGG